MRAVRTFLLAALMATTGWTFSCAAERLTEARGERDRWREEASAWRGQAERLALPKPEPGPDPEPAVTWWRWLRTTG
jgi:hypothetical protein